MRRDSIGLFWEDLPVEKVKSEKAAKPKRTPPPRIWERPDYLPGLEEARRFNVDLYTDLELLAAAQNRERLVLDVECYPNYFLMGFKGMKTGKVVYSEMVTGGVLNIAKMQWIMNSFCVVTFNGHWYDIPIIALAFAGCNCAQLKDATNRIIDLEQRPSDVLKSFKVKKLEVNHIDLMEVAPGAASLKTYAGRAHARRMQDLPVNPNVFLSDDQITIVRWYWVNDLDNTQLLYMTLEEQIALRENLSAEYGIDLRSKSDAQIAEAVISAEVEKLNGTRCTKPVIPVGTAYNYQAPAFLRYQSELMNWVLGVVRNELFVVDESGSIGLTDQIKALKISMGHSTYQMGMGGLHSTEKTAGHVAGPGVVLEDRDVVSYYPFIILNNSLYPAHLGANFLRVYRMLVERRLGEKASAKRLIDQYGKAENMPVGVRQAYEKHTKNADSLKIVINGSFGKLGSKYSVLYSPNLLIQVTLTGQLALLMLIERMELAGIPVVSANTDGIVMKCPVDLIPVKDAIVAQWERETQFETEATNYSALYSRDVNNYIAIKTNGTTKTKGVFAKANLQKAPKSLICIDAITKLLTEGKAISETIRQCADISKFVTVQKVAGGAVKVLDSEYDAKLPHADKVAFVLERGGLQIADGHWLMPGASDREASDLETVYKALCAPLRIEYLGSTVRWYYATGEQGELVYAKNGNMVPRTDGAAPLMTLPKALPEDIDYEWYEKEANAILQKVGYA